MFRLAQRDLSELPPGAMEHITIRLAQIICAPSRAGLEEGCRGSGAGARLLARDGTPIVRVSRKQARAALDALVRLHEFLHWSRALAHHHVARLDCIIGDLPLMQRAQQTALAQHECGATRISLAEEIRGVEKLSIKMTSCYSW